MQSGEARMYVVTIRWQDGTEVLRGPFESEQAALAWSDEEPRDLLDGEAPTHEIGVVFPTIDRLISIVKYDGPIPDASNYVRDQAETQSRVNEHEADGLFTGWDGWTVTN